MKIAILGPRGTYTEKAAEKYDKNSEIIPYRSITRAFKAVVQKDTDMGIVPIYNKIEGMVNETFDCLWQYNYAESNEKSARIIDVAALNIVHCIGSLHKASKIEKILSHQQALRQCSRYLDEHYPDAEIMETASTAQAAEMIKQNWLNAAAIGSEDAMMKYGLEIIDKNIVKDNKTLFAIISDKKTEPTGNDITSIAIRPEEDEIGFLHGITGIWYGGNINMTLVYSRPDREWGLILYMDIAGHEKDSHVASAIDLIRHYLKKKHGEIKILGSYKRPAIAESGVKELRKKIDKIDKGIIGLIAERMKAVSEIAEYKSKSDMPIRDFKRENDLIAIVRKEAESLGLDANFADRIMRAVIKESVKRESNSEIKTASFPKSSLS